MMPYFDIPWALVAAPVLAVAVAALLMVAFRKRRRRLAALGQEGIVARLIPVAATRSPIPRIILLSLATIFAGIAYAGPRWGTERAIVRAGGADIVLALDASLSMRATDERPDRLERMKQEARRFLAGSPSDRFGLIAFAGRSYILTPLTVDKGALELYLDNLDPSVVGQAGSSLARAIRQGTDLLLTSRSGSDRALVIMSDGEAFEPESDVVEAAKRAAESGITLVTVGFGTTAGATIPERGAGGQTLKRDENGEIVVSRHTPELLEAAARAANGVYIAAAATDKAANIRRSLATLRRQGRMAQAGAERRPQFQLFLLPALLCLLADTLLAERRGARRRAPAAARTAAAALLFALALPGRAHAAGTEGDELFRARRYAEAAEAYRREIVRGDRSPRVQYNYGTALILAGRADEAIESLERAALSTDLETRYRALFNLGYIFLERGRRLEGDAATQAFAAAVDAYKRALRARPDELDAKWNYELARHREQASGGGGGGGGETSEEPREDPAAQPREAMPRPAGSLSERQAEQILNSAARDEQEVQGRKQRTNQPDTPPRGKDW
jgi:Ca-activated chloride channel family protein